MIYFIKTYFQDEIEKQQTEVSLRKYAIKRHTSLDLQSSSTDIGTDKLFLGLEGTKDLKFTRIRTSFERVLPKLIISLPKSSDLYYKVRFSLLSTLVFILISFGLILNIAFLISGRTNIDNLLSIIIFYSCYFLLFFIELRLTKSRIGKAIKKASTIKDKNLAD